MMELKPPQKIPLLVLLIAGASVLFVYGCANESKLKVPEEQFDTGGNDLSVFHRIAERDQGLGLRFPGFIVGIEKARRESIGAGNCSFFRGSGQAYDRLDPGAFADEDYYKDVQRTLNDCKRMFVSNITEYRFENRSGFPHVEEDIRYSAYDRENNAGEGDAPDDVYGRVFDRGQRELLVELRKRLTEVVEAADSKQPYSHILFYSMGWNTDQQEALRNYNSLIMQLLQVIPADTGFRPLFIGITWPSEWSWFAFEGFGKVLSYPVKSRDADEAAILQANPFLYRVLIPLKRKHRLPLILLGHSFGARLMTRAVFSLPTEAQRPAPCYKDIDLMIALQGAFSVNRFIAGAGREGSPYRDFSDHARKFVLTWSEHDAANPLAAFVTFARHAGGEPGYERSREAPDVFEQFKIRSRHAGSDGDCRFKNHYEMCFRDVVSESAEANSAAWRQSFRIRDRVSMVDASGIVFRQPHNKGGKAHSDIYSPAVAGFIWDAIVNTERSREAEAARGERLECG